MNAFEESWLQRLLLRRCALWIRCFMRWIRLHPATTSKRKKLHLRFIWMACQSFHTNQEDVKLLKDPAYRGRMARAEAAGILDWLGLPIPDAIRDQAEADAAVEWITSQGIVLGDTSGDLMLDQPLTWRQFAVMLYRYDQQRR